MPETDENGIVMLKERVQIVTDWARINKETAAALSMSLCLAQRQADIEAVKGVPNPIQGRVYGDARVRQDAWDEYQEAILNALKAQIVRTVKLR